MTEILIKRLSQTISIPKYETVGLPGMDLAANIKEPIKQNQERRQLFLQEFLCLYLKILKYNKT